MGRLRRRLEVAVGREGRHAVERRRPRQLLLEGHRLRLRLDLEGCDVAPDRDRSRILGKRRRSLVNAARQSCGGAWRWSRRSFTRASARAGQNSAAVRAADSALHLNMKYKLSLVLRRAAARARKETVYHYTTEPQTCVLAS